MNGGVPAERRLPELREVGLVGRLGVDVHERDLDPILHVLAGEPERVGPDRELDHGVGGAVDLGDERGEVGAIDRRPQLLDDPATKAAEDPGEGTVHLEPSHEVRANRDDLPPPRDLEPPVRRRHPRPGSAL